MLRNGADLRKTAYRSSKPNIDYRTQYTKDPQYRYSFNISLSARWGEEGTHARVETDRYGRGFIYVGNDIIPIDLIGKGKSKAMRKAAGILHWWIEQKYTCQHAHPQKRASQRARKKLRSASRRSHMPSKDY